MKEDSADNRMTRKKRFCVMVEEMFKCYVEVDATDEDEARDIVERHVEGCDLIAPRNYDDFARNITVLRTMKADE